MAIAAAAAQAQNAPDWQTTAGGKMAFEVASVRENPSPKYNSSIPTDADEDWVPSGGLFNVNGSLAGLISFAYKLPQQHNLLQHLPDWAKTKSFDVQARAAGDPTKDQMRLMVQALLAERFKLALHFETQDTQVLVMSLAKPGTMGPRLRLHKDGPPCDVVTPRPPGATITFNMFPCKGYMSASDRPDVILAGARDTTVELMAAFFSNVGHMRPIVDRTGIAERIDFSMEYVPAARGAAAPNADGQASVPGTTFEQAVRDQLGLKLEPAKVPLEIPVVDHVELPSEN
jgi:uncharacterized protein (TIGR03435 family)